MALDDGRIEMRADEGRYRLLVESITDYAIYMLDTDGTVTSWNPGAQRFKGYTAEEIVGRHFSRFYSEEDQAAGVPARALMLAETEGRFEAEGWRIRKDGTRFWAHVVIDPIRVGDELVGYAKITRDLTERKKAQEALHASQEQFRLLVQGVTDYAIYMLDMDGHVASWNQGARRIKGYAPREILGRHFSEFYTEEDRAAGLPGQALATALAEGRFETEGWRVRKDGTRFQAHVIVDVIRDEAGEPIGFAKITRDVTERLENQRALEQAREALFQAQKIEAIGQLTGGVAHDFNNLLAAILGSLELVRKRLPYDPRITPLLENAVQGAERGAALTERMLAFARKQELTMQAVDVPVLVRGMADFMQRTLGGTIDLQLVFPGRLPKIHTDANQLEASLLNLVVNSRDAMPAGGSITITARTERIVERGGQLEPGDYVLIEVTDTGEGMDAETVARSAEPFFTTKGVGKGTGLGLSMVHGLAAQSGGRIGVKSEVGKGTTIDLWFPAFEGEVVDPIDGPMSVSPLGADRLLVLVVDDDNLVLTNTTAMLDDLGHEVLSASSGREALALLHQHPEVDLVVTDEVMPGMTGTELAVAIRARAPQMPVILATGYADLLLETKPRSLNLPRLAKPFTQAQLAKAVDASVERAA
ncbi:PAS domain S-box-containing protein [Brevundimonas lenta]|uniref:histidine kinase n=2 Tax=Brevundimonas lenta TaxID=424796 RepID=A0A7W6JEM7_9CAUL|nr:PAS domain S-box-containing protein [Brevundimonas lenta]